MWQHYEMILRPLTLEDEAQALQAHAELALDNFGFLLGGYQVGEAWAPYISRVEAATRGEGLPEGFVPATFLVAEIEGKIVGRTSIRHELNDYLLERGGHIGYGVRPEFRKQGIATQILVQSLELARDLGIARALITCDDDNIGSSKVIEKCGGVLENVIELEDGVKLRRYWVLT
jgi:predicted acetyltransferase